MTYFCLVLTMFWGIPTYDPNYSIRRLLESELHTVPVIECIEVSVADVMEETFSDVWEQVDEELEKQGTDPSLITNDSY